MIASMALLRALGAAAAALILSSCGGHGGPAVSNMTAANVRYGSTLIVSVSGSGLAEGVQFAVDGPCVNVTTVGTVTDTQAQFTCTINGVGTLRPSVRPAGGGNELGSVRVEVPLPRVSLTVTDGTRTGTILLEIDPVSAPQTAAQFMAYATTTGTEAGTSFYASTLFHRVNPAVGILGGGFTSSTDGVISAKAPTRSPIAFEATGLKNVRGSIALYREGDANSGNAMFFINTVDNPQFDPSTGAADPGYAVFGRVIEGLNVVDEVAQVPVRPDISLGVVDVPVTAVRISAVAQTR